MPKSKSRRKKNGKPVVKKNKMAKSAIFLEQAAIESVESLYNKAYLKAELTLGAGMCNFDDIALIRDVINVATWCLIYLDRITMDLSPEWYEANQDAFDKGKNAFHSLYSRGNEMGGVTDKSVRYVCTGEELTAIKECVSIAGQIIDEMITNRPQKFVALFQGMKRFLVSHRTGRRLIFTAADIEKVIRKQVGR